MRLFTAIAIPDEIAANLEHLIDHLRPTARIRWSSARSLHVTTRFIGEWLPERLEELKHALSEVPPVPAFEIQVRGFGWFPNPHHPRVLWVGIHAGECLRDLAGWTDDATSRLGIARDEKRFLPHLTLARIGDPVPLLDLKHKIVELPSDEFGRFSVQSWGLYRSEPGPSGSLYTRLAEYPLYAK
jgi:RNA 2',3'-cyclic 3'-phosphodiesterase